MRKLGFSNRHISYFEFRISGQSDFVKVIAAILPSAPAAHAAREEAMLAQWYPSLPKLFQLVPSSVE